MSLRLRRGIRKNPTTLTEWWTLPILNVGSLALAILGDQMAHVTALGVFAAFLASFGIGYMGLRWTFDLKPRKAIMVTIILTVIVWTIVGAIA